MSEGYVEKSLSVESSDMDKINQFTRAKLDAGSVYIFSVVLCNNDIDRDFEKFSLSTLKQLKDLFVGRTGIFDHSMKSSNQKARIFDTWIEKSDGKRTTDGEDFYQLKAKAYMLKNDENMTLINEIDAGIKKEVSVSCSVEKSICSVCNHDKRQGMCEHISGKIYDDSLAYTILEGAKDVFIDICDILSRSYNVMSVSASRLAVDECIQASVLKTSFTIYDQISFGGDDY